MTNEKRKSENADDTKQNNKRQKVYVVLRGLQFSFLSDDPQPSVLNDFNLKGDRAQLKILPTPPHYFQLNELRLNDVI
ncbi:hypothetical protein T06_1154, partial [Trichinella sp. T6]